MVMCDAHGCPCPCFSTFFGAHLVFGCLLISDAVRQWRPAAHARHAGHDQAAVPAGQLRAHVRGAAAGNSRYNSNVTVLTSIIQLIMIIVLIEYCVNELR